MGDSRFLEVFNDGIHYPRFRSFQRKNYGNQLTIRGVGSNLGDKNMCEFQGDKYFSSCQNTNRSNQDFVDIYKTSKWYVRIVESSAHLQIDRPLKWFKLCHWDNYI